MSNNEQVSIPLHLCFFLAILLAFVGFTWYESIFESFLGQVKLLLMVSPLLLLLLLAVATSSWDQEAIHTPWGLGLLLVLLFFMISYHSHFRDRCFPLLT